MNADTVGARRQIKGWLFDDVVFERHAGEPPFLPKHAHDAYQIGTTTRNPGEYLCSGRKWIAPPGSMMVFHPGEVHSAPRAGVRSASAVSKLIFVAPARIRSIAAALGRTPTLPRFHDRVIREARFIADFCAFHDLMKTDASLLEKESSLLATLEQLILRFGSDRSAPARPERHRAKVMAVREYVEAHFADNISLSELADVVQISPYHLSRVFGGEIGMPPHAFQTQVRIERAKSLLLCGMPVAAAATETGFFDQSHFTRHFRRIVGVAPSRYVSGAGMRAA